MATLRTVEDKIDRMLAVQEVQSNQLASIIAVTSQVSQLLEALNSPVMRAFMPKEAKQAMKALESQGF